MKRGMDNQQRDQNTILITYTNNIGELEDENNSTADVTLLYGPYKGDEVFTLTVTELEVDYDYPMEKKSWKGVELSYTEIGDHFIISARHNKLSYSSEGRITNIASIEQQLDWFIQVIQNV